MANELDAINLDDLSMDRVKELKNAAVERLKEAGDTMPMLQVGHQDGMHASHTNHATGPENQGG